MKDDVILLSHGSGGGKTSRLIGDIFLKHLGNDYLSRLEDGSVLPLDGEKAVFTTDSYVVNPVFFPGGNIGELAVNGTVNDIAVMGAEPMYISLGLILEEGLSLEELERIIASVGEAAREAGVMIVTGDTKVVERGSGDKIFINTSGIGVPLFSPLPAAERIEEGDRIMVTGPVGDHGLTVMLARKNLGIESGLKSDTAPLNGLIKELAASADAVKMMRDATRGGVATVLSEIAERQRLSVELEEETIPVRGEVSGACEMLGFDPLYLANEGRAVVFLKAGEADKALRLVKNHPLGEGAALIGEVTGRDPQEGRVVLKTSVGGRRIIKTLEGEQYPRIC